MAHAILAPSKALRWMTCPGSVNLEKMFPDTSSSYADEGTLAHAWAAHFLEPEMHSEPVDKLPEELFPYVRQYIDFVNEQTGDDIREIEYSVDISQITGEAQAKGTIDCAALVGNTLKIIDLKFGSGVKVEAKENPQLTIYALGALPFFELFDEVKTVEMTIFQPRMNNIQTWTISIEELKRMGQIIHAKAVKAIQFLNATELPNDALNASNEHACKFCKAKAVCEPYKEMAAKLLNFQELDDNGNPVKAPPESKDPIDVAKSLSPESLSECLKLADRLDDWITAVRQRATDELLAGVRVPDFKLVLGRAGNRTWSDAAQAEALMKVFKLKEDERYCFKLISPTQAEKLYKAGRIGERQWPKLAPLITRSDPKPTVVPQNDERPEWVPVSKPSDFSPIAKGD